MKKKETFEKGRQMVFVSVSYKYKTITKLEWYYDNAVMSFIPSPLPPTCTHQHAFCVGPSVLAANAAKASMMPHAQGRTCIHLCTL